MLLTHVSQTPEILEYNKVTTMQMEYCNIKVYFIIPKFQPKVFEILKQG